MSNVDKETGIWSLTIAKKRHKCDLDLVDIIYAFYEPRTMADVGCGSGMYCKEFATFGWNVVGYEGTKDVISLGEYDKIIQIDLTTKLKVPKYDLTICLEVGEHIPKKHEKRFLDNLCLFVKKDLILSWAPEGQYSASGHVNCRPREYIIAELEKRNLFYHKLKSEFLRKDASFSWFQNNLMVFMR